MENQTIYSNVRLSSSANKRPGSGTDVENQEYMCGGGGGAGTSQLHDLTYAASGVKWHLRHTLAPMSVQIMVPGPGGLTGTSP